MSGRTESLWCENSREAKGSHLASELIRHTHTQANTPSPSAHGRMIGQGRAMGVVAMSVKRSPFE